MLQRDSNPWPPRYRCVGLSTELWSLDLLSIVFLKTFCSPRTLCPAYTIWENKDVKQGLKKRIGCRFQPLPPELKGGGERGAGWLMVRCERLWKHFPHVSYYMKFLCYRILLCFCDFLEITIIWCHGKNAAGLLVFIRRKTGQILRVRENVLLRNVDPSKLLNYDDTKTSCITHFIHKTKNVLALCYLNLS